MNKLLYYLPTILFNVFELLIIGAIGLLMGATIPAMICILLVFTLVRNLLGGGKHYKSPLLCLIWSMLVFILLFYISTISFALAIVLAIFYAMAQTGRVDVQEMFMWKHKDAGYNYLQEFIDKMKDTTALKTFENKLAIVNPKAYKVYKYRFKENYKFSDISDILEMDTRRISEILKSIDLCLKMYFDIKV